MAIGELGGRVSKGEQGGQGEDDNSIESEVHTSTFLSLPSTTIYISH